MATLSLRLITASLLAVPLLAFAGPPAGHGNGHGNGTAGEHGNGNGQASAQPSTQHAGNQGEPGSRGDLGQGEGQEDTAGGGRANLQGAAHANYHAIQAVCSHPNAAAHSALGINCPGVVGSRDARTGTHVYTQPGMGILPAPAATIGRGADTIKHPQRQSHKPTGDQTELGIPAEH